MRNNELNKDENRYFKKTCWLSGNDYKVALLFKRYWITKVHVRKKQYLLCIVAQIFCSFIDLYSMSQG